MINVMPWPVFAFASIARTYPVMSLRSPSVYDHSIQHPPSLRIKSSISSCALTPQHEALYSTNSYSRLSSAYTHIYLTHDARTHLHHHVVMLVEGDARLLHVHEVLLRHACSPSATTHSLPSSCFTPLRTTHSRPHASSPCPRFHAYCSMGMPCITECRAACWCSLKSSSSTVFSISMPRRFSLRFCDWRYDRKRERMKRWRPTGNRGRNNHS